MTSAAYSAVAMAVVVVMGLACSVAALDTPSYCGDSPNTIPPLTGAQSATNPELIQVQVYIRHGDRTPAFDSPCWANDSAVWNCELSQLQHTSIDIDEATPSFDRVYRHRYMAGVEVLPGNCGLGQLTVKGYKQQIANGQALRAAYIERAGLLPDSYEGQLDQFHLRSDNAARTMESGQALFSGLYPPASPSTAQDGCVNVAALDWWVMTEDTDTMTTNTRRCPALNKLADAAAASPAYVKHLATVTTPLARRASIAFGLPVSDGWNSTGINLKLDCLMTHVCHDKAIPAGVDQSLFNAIINEVTYQYNYQLSWPDYARLAMGALVREMYANMQASIDGTAAAKKFWLYAGHDDGPIMPLLATFGVYNDIWCSYASMITFELYKTTSSHAVRMTYNGAVMSIPGCSDTLCDWQEFSSIAQSLIPNPQECQA